MPSVSKSVELDLPQEEAFALATDPARFGEWLSLHAGWPNGAPEVLEQGAQFTQTLKLMGMPAEVAWTVSEVDAPARLVMSGAGPMGVSLGTTITTSGDGPATTISYEAEFSGGMIEGPMGDTVAQTAGQEIETSLAKLKELA